MKLEHKIITLPSKEIATFGKISTKKLRHFIITLPSIVFMLKANIKPYFKNITSKINDYFQQLKEILISNYKDENDEPLYQTDDGTDRFVLNFISKNKFLQISEESNH